MFKSLGGLLPEALNRLKVRKPVEAVVVCRTCDEELGKLWDHAVPMRAISYQGGTLTVAVTSSAWAQEVTNKSERVKSATNKRLGGTPVSRVRTRVAPGAAWDEEA